MQFRNSYTPPASAEIPPLCFLDTPAEEYDHNFCGGPLHPMATDKVMLIPFVPSLHLRRYHAEIRGQPELMRYMPYTPHPSESIESACQWVEMYLRRVPVSSVLQPRVEASSLMVVQSLQGTCLFAIFDLTRIGATDDLDGDESVQLPSGHPPLRTLAGVVGLLNVDRQNLIGELGHLVVLPKAQRSHVTTHAVALLMHYALDHPFMQQWSAESQTFVDVETEGKKTPAPLVAPFIVTEPHRALGLRRFQWQAHHRNGPSAAAAQRLGFLPEGITRAHRCVPQHVVDGEAGRAGDGRELASRSSFVAALTWRDWLESGARDRLNDLVARKPNAK